MDAGFEAQKAEFEFMAESVKKAMALIRADGDFSVDLDKIDSNLDITFKCKPVGARTYTDVVVSYAPLSHGGQPSGTDKAGEALASLIIEGLAEAQAEKLALLRLKGMVLGS